MAASAVQNNNFWVLLKNYDSIFYWKRIKGEHIYETLKRNATIIPYQRESQGEAICFDHDNMGVYTVSENKFSPIYFFGEENNQLRYLPTIGSLLPTPNAFGDTRIIGQNWFRLYSLLFTIFNVLSTNAASKPWALISDGPCLLSIY